MCKEKWYEKVFIAFVGCGNHSGKCERLLEHDGDILCGGSGAFRGNRFIRNFCGSGKGDASGSSALYPLVNDAKNKFKSINPDVSITLNGGGSGTGLKQVSDGSVDIGNSDVEAASKLAADKAKELVDHKICVITMAPIVNKDVAAKVKRPIVKNR